MDRAARQQRLKTALWNGRTQAIKSLVADDPDIAQDAFALKCALFDAQGVRDWLARDPSVVHDAFGPRGRPINHLAFSRVLQVFPEREADMIEVAALLVAAGADVNDAFVPPENTLYGALTPLYGAIGFAGNMALGRWLLDRGANPTDPEALYHGCELGHAEGIRMLCEAGADPNGTNALKRAMDFDNAEMVALLLNAGADPNEGADGWTSLHHAALRRCSAPVCQLLLDAGADPAITGRGISAYAAARVYGHAVLADMLPAVALSPQESLLAQAVTGDVPDGAYIDPNGIPEVYLDLVRELAVDVAHLDHIKALIKLGMPWDRGDVSSASPLQVAGWLGQPEILAYFLALKPELGPRDGNGGGIFSNILHGSQNNPLRAKGDYIGCLRLVLEEGVALPENAIWIAGDPQISAFLKDWATRFPQQVIKHGFP